MIAPERFRLESAKEYSVPPYTLDHIKNGVSEAAAAYNAAAQENDRVRHVSLFGSYADGCATSSSDVDLLIGFESPAVSLLSLAKVLSEMEERIGTEVDIVQDPIPAGSLLAISKVIPLYAA